MSNYSGRELVMVEMDRVLPTLQSKDLLPASTVAYSIVSLAEYRQAGPAGFFRPDSGLCAMSGFGSPAQFHSGVFNQ